MIRLEVDGDEVLATAEAPGARPICRKLQGLQDAVAADAPERLGEALFGDGRHRAELLAGAGLDCDDAAAATAAPRLWLECHQPEAFSVVTLLPGLQRQAVPRVGADSTLLGEQGIFHQIDRFISPQLISEPGGEVRNRAATAGRRQW